MTGRGTLTPDRPFCGDTNHVLWDVWRDGFRGVAPSRRQRWRCVNPADRSQWHRFTLDVLRVEAAQWHCSDCQRPVPANAGPIIAAGYHYYATVVADALAALAGGATYQGASATARAELARARTSRRARLRLHRAPETEPSNNGQLACDWVEAFAPTVLDDPEPWAEVLLLDATTFWRRRPGRKVPAFTVLLAYGYDLNYGPHPAPDDEFTTPEPNYTNGRLLAATAVKSANREAWQAFLASRPGNPVVVVADGAAAIRRAVSARWARTSGFSPPEFVRCQWHLTENLRAAARKDISRLNSYQSGLGTPGTYQHPETHPLVTDAREALTKPTAWLDYRNTAYTLLAHHRAFTNYYPSAVLKWLHQNETLVLAQQARRRLRPGPASIGPLEAHIATLRPWLKRRAQGIRNPDRTNLLLALMVAGINHRVSRSAWADLIYDELAHNETKPVRTQRRLVGRHF